MKASCLIGRTLDLKLKPVAFGFDTKLIKPTRQVCTFGLLSSLLGLWGKFVKQEAILGLHDFKLFKETNKVITRNNVFVGLFLGLMLLMMVLVPDLVKRFWI